MRCRCNSGISENIHKNIAEYQRIERLKCAASIEYFAANYVNIRSAGGVEELFSLRDYQSRFFLEASLTKKIILRATRISGLSHLLIVKMAHELLFSKDVSIEFLSSNYECTQRPIQEVVRLLSDLPEWLRLSNMVQKRKDLLKLCNGNVLQKASSETLQIRLGSSQQHPSLVIIDNAALITKGDALRLLEMLESPEVVKKAQVIIASTKVNNDRRNFFNSLFGAAVTGISDYTPINIGCDDAHDGHFLTEQLSILGTDEFERSFECRIKDTSPYINKRDK